VILQTLASLVILAATAAPGRVFESRVDKRKPRHFRSTFAEYVELVMIGATTTLVAVVIVVLLGGALGGLDLSQLLPHPKQYVDDEPWRVALGAAVALALSFLIAYLAPLLIANNASHTEGWSYYDRSIWLRTFEDDRPKDKGVAIAARLKAGTDVIGTLTGFTPVEAEDREMRLQQLSVGEPGKTPVPLTHDAFMVLRESEISFMIGEYVDKVQTDAAPTEKPRP
jgi:hypothetical protein